MDWLANQTKIERAMASKPLSPKPRCCESNRSEPERSRCGKKSHHMTEQVQCACIYEGADTKQAVAFPYCLAFVKTWEGQTQEADADANL